MQRKYKIEHSHGAVYIDAHSEYEATEIFQRHFPNYI